MAESGYPDGERARELGLCARTIRNWVGQVDRDGGRRDDCLTSFDVEKLMSVRLSRPCEEIARVRILEE